MKKTNLILLIIVFCFLVTACGKKNVIVNNNVKEPIEEQIESETEVVLDNFLLELENCNDETQTFEKLKLFFDNLSEEININSCSDLFDKINNNGNGSLINGNELVNNGLIYEQSEIDRIISGDFNQKIICDKNINKCNLVS